MTDPARLRLRTAFVVDAAGGVVAVASLMGVSPRRVSRWRTGQATVEPAYVSRLLDLDHVFALAQIAWTPDVARIWMSSPNGHLGGASPADVLAAHGSGEVVDALGATLSGAYA